MATKKSKSPATMKRKPKAVARTRAKSTAKGVGGGVASAQGRSAAAHTSTNRDEIRTWAEKRGGQPACVRGTGGKGDIGMLRIDFPGYSGEETLQHISWDDWFNKFEERQLALLYQDETAGGARSNFNKLISRTSSAPAKAKPKTRTAGGGS